MTYTVVLLDHGNNGKFSPHKKIFVNFFSKNAKFGDEKPILSQN